MCTVELNFWHKFKRFGTRKDLFENTSVSWFVNPRKAKQHGLDESFFSLLRLNEDEVVPGWIMSVVKSDDEQDFLLSLIRTPESVVGSPENGLFASDKNGVIYVGSADIDRSSFDLCVRADSVPGLAAIDDSSLFQKSGTARNLLRWLASATFSGGQIQPNVCNCNCTCSTSGQCYCYVAGCRSCPFCCSGACSDCVIICGKRCACCNP